ncbi:MAG: DUF721 domain-containing protein [Elainellaceae cyanobacterium]
MPFNSLNQVLNALEKHDTWKQRQQFRQLWVCWTEVVGIAVSAQTRPLFIQRQVLQVATSSSSWAQNLAFERHRILEKLNARLPYQLTDIRFSPAQWRSSNKSDAASAESDILWQNHPSQLLHSSGRKKRAFDPASAPAAHALPTDPQTAFQTWAAVVQARSRHLPPCPICQCPTPPGELQRWSICALCAAKQMK